MSSEVIGNVAAHRASRGERRVLAATVVTGVALIGAMLLGLHLAVREYLVQWPGWPF
jgi:hypothetical protein